MGQAAYGDALGARGGERGHVLEVDATRDLEDGPRCVALALLRLGQLISGGVLDEMSVTNALLGATTLPEKEAITIVEGMIQNAMLSDARKFNQKI